MDQAMRVMAVMVALAGEDRVVVLLAVVEVAEMAREAMATEEVSIRRPSGVAKSMFPLACATRP